MWETSLSIEKKKKKNCNLLSWKEASSGRGAPLFVLADRVRLGVST